MTNSERYPEAWAIFVEHARNIQGLNLGADYEISHPDRSGRFIQANSPEMLFFKFNEAYMLEINVGARVRKHLDWLEKIEGKQ